MLKDMPDLMRDVVRFNVKAEFLDDQRLADWREALRQDTLVSDLYFEAANTSNVGDNIRSLGIITLALGVFSLSSQPLRSSITPSGWPCIPTVLRSKIRNWWSVLGVY